MTREQFDQGILDFNQGEASFNHGINIYAFLFKNNWYPVDAFVKHVTGRNYNTYQGVKLLVDVLPYLRFKNVSFDDCGGLPVRITQEDILLELKYLSVHFNNLIEN
ncbi:hypothetical protein [Algoriphagus limi]|uniref:HEPN domain-containing protein n=1 Tax=Algoriphagus limi TaxID=2975273 RepID=A0ABT2G0S0_9BACT|nr:hypothetical protein [Algoriphagus limi]MCS5488868.1 hypothetical protein [Algoriphagus limi]